MEELPQQQKVSILYLHKVSIIVSIYKKDFSLHCCVQNGSGAHPASYPMGTRRGLSLGVKQPRHKADHSPPSNAEVKE
jgi:hypothetical protein